MSSDSNQYQDAEQKAANIIRLAKERAAEIRLHAEHEAQAIMQQAKTEGENAGDDASQEIFEAIEQKSKNLKNGLSEWVLQGAFRLAEKDIPMLFAENPERLLQMIIQLLPKVAQGAQYIHVRVHPQQLEFVRQNTTRLLDALGVRQEIEVREDRHIENWSVLIQTDSGVIDAQLKTQFHELSRSVGVEEWRA
jgi:flagellar biosynthesis/type III secretory pathway protein FliH